ncbi:MAG: GNAT family N-acetyltransferase [Clostridiaceae bacterium]|nr:GNAT family N-acetyltransferase [Clostridiaceae bacterium]
MINYMSLENISVEEVYDTFIKAFSDYQVKVYDSLDNFINRLNFEGYNRKASIGSFESGRLVGFMLNGIRKWNGQITAYDMGTGIIKQYRNKGLTTNMFSKVKSNLIGMGVNQYLLEVIKNNEPAFNLYKKQGFEISREFNCFKLEKSNFKSTMNYKIKFIDEFNEDLWEKCMTFWDCKPSWQNSIQSIQEAKDSFCYCLAIDDEDIVGYGIINKANGNIPQLAVDKNYRKQQIGKSIVTQMINLSDSNTISIINVDKDCQSINNFLTDNLFENFIDQYEMILEI